jgi:putative endonuclease
MVNLEVVYYFYILRCADNSLYCGMTNDLEKRMEKHNSGKGAKYLRGKLPVKLVYSKKYENRSEALKREAEVKKWSKGKKEELVSGILTS